MKHGSSRLLGRRGHPARRELQALDLKWEKLIEIVRPHQMIDVEAPVTQNAVPEEAFILAECIAPTRERAAEVVRTTKQYLLQPSMSNKPISDLRRRMIADMTVRSFSDKTQHDYIRHIETFAKFLGRSPDTATRATCSC
jgi:hypothetical protein